MSEEKVIKVAICIPCYGDPRAKFMQSLTTMIIHTLSARLNDADGKRIRVHMEVFIVSGSMLVESRHRLVAEAMAWGADYMLCLDADHVFPHDTFCRLWSRNLPIVGANYPRRATPTGPTAAAQKNAEGVELLLYTTEEKAAEGVVEPCAHLGFGCLLVNMQVFGVLQEYADKEWGGTILPLFKFEPTENYRGTVGEDVFFFRKMAQAGIVPFVDHGLSWEVGHLHDVILTNAHACVQKDRWEEQRRTAGDKFKQAAERIEQECAD